MMVKNIIFDFDGVILDSMAVRELGFRKIFAAYDEALVEELLQYHQENGGLSRYNKIAYFYNEILHEPITQTEIDTLATAFSEIMRVTLTDHRYLIAETVAFLQRNAAYYRLHIASGSDQNELRYLCEALGLTDYFLSIHGSPVHKNKLVEMILSEYEYTKEETILIGDSINDYTAAHVNGIDFYGYNNNALDSVSVHYLDTYTILDKKKERKHGTSL